jgi:hypothetical protein
MTEKTSVPMATNQPIIEAANFQQPTEYAPALVDPDAEVEAGED